MNKYSISFSSDNSKITFAPSSGKGTVEIVDAVPAVNIIDAMKDSREEINVRGKHTNAALSMVVYVFANTTVFDEYKGKTPANEKLPANLRQAFRDAEVTIFKPLFENQLGLKEKGNTPAQIEKQWQDYVGALREGGMYSNAKSTALQYFAIVGQLPYVNGDSSQLMPVKAMQKIIANMREATPHKGIVGKLSDIRDEFNNRDNKTLIGDINTGVAILSDLLKQFQGLQREAAEKASQNAIALAKPEDIAKQNQKVMEDQKNLTKELGPTLVDASAKALAAEATRRASKKNKGKEQPMDSKEILGTPALI